MASLSARGSTRDIRRLKLVPASAAWFHLDAQSSAQGRPASVQAEIATAASEAGPALALTREGARAPGASSMTDLQGPFA